MCMYLLIAKSYFVQWKAADPSCTEQIHWARFNSAQGTDAEQQKGMT